MVPSDDWNLQDRASAAWGRWDVFELDAAAVGIVAATLVAWALAWGLGARGRAKHQEPATVVGFVAVSVVALLAATSRTPPVLWDVAFGLALAAVGLAMGLVGGADRRALVGGLVAMVASLLVVEAGVRWLVPPPPDAVVTRLHDSGPPCPVPRDDDVPPEGRLVLHTGDSLPACDDVTLEGRHVAAVLDADRVGEHRHLCVSRADRGPDIEAWCLQELARGWPRLWERVDLVVWNVFAGNDLDDLARPVGYLGGRPPYEIGPDGGLVAGTRRPRTRWSHAIEVSMPPRALAVTFDVSVTSQHLLIRLAHFRRWFLGLPLAAGIGTPAQRELLRVLAVDRKAWFEAQGKDVLVVALPDRVAFVPDGVSAETADAARTAHGLLVDAFGDAGFDVHDATPWVLGLLDTEGEAAFAHPNDPHFSELGHRAWAANVGPLIADHLTSDAPTP